MSNNYGFEPTLDGLNTIDADSTTTTDIVCDNLTVNVSGTAPTMSAYDNSTHLATTAFVNSHVSANYVTIGGPAQTITGEKTFSNTNTIVSGTLKNDSHQGSTTTSTQNIGTTQTSGILNIATLASRSGAVNINTGSTNTSRLNISNQTTGKADVFIGSLNSTTQIVEISSTNLKLNTGFSPTTNLISIGSGQTSSDCNILANTYFGGNLELATGNLTTSSGVSLFLTTNGVADDINLSSSNDIFIDSINSITNQINSVNKQTITSTDITSNPTTTITNQINSVNKQTITSSDITNYVPTINSGLTYPLTSDIQIGYTNSLTTSTRMSVANTNYDIASIAITQKGCYIVEGNYLFTGTPTTLNHVFLGLSTTSVTFDSNRQCVATSANQTTLTGAHITSVFNVNDLVTTIYLIGRVTSNLNAATLQTNFLSITKIA